MDIAFLIIGLAVGVAIGLLIAGRRHDGAGEMQAQAREALLESQRRLQQSNREQIGDLLGPLRQEMTRFSQEVGRQRTEQAATSQGLRDKFDEMMRSYAAVQERAVRQLAAETLRVGTQADTLTRALLHQSKTRGDWGEMVLQKLLEDSGLESPGQYELQYGVKDDEGADRRPDVVVHFPTGRNVVIDSKVTLAAYTEASGADDAATRDAAMRRHLQAVRNHVTQLGAKSYEGLVGDTLDVVLMFMPVEGAYIEALRLDPSLVTWAYKRKVVIASQTTLMTTLSLVYLMWQQERQTRGIERIVAQATSMYDKAVSVNKYFGDVGAALDSLTRKYDLAAKALGQGRGNLLSQIDNLRSQGITPKKPLDIPDDTGGE